MPRYWVIAPYHADRPETWEIEESIFKALVGKTDKVEIEEGVEN
jgi:hypothetical protein